MAQAITDLPDGGDDIASILNGTYVGEYVNADITQLRASAFEECTKLTRVSLPNCNGRRYCTSTFRSCSELVEIDIPSWVVDLGDRSCENCGKLRIVNAPKLTSVGQYIFQSSPLTDTHIFPELVTLRSSIVFRNCMFTHFVLPKVQTLVTNTFLACNEVVTLDFGSVTRFNNQALNGNAVLENIIIRTGSVATLTNQNALWGNTNEPPVHKKIYVPSSLIVSYQTATNWSALYNNGWITFHAIEGSAFEDTDWWKEA